VFDTDQAALRVQGMHDAAKKVNPDSGAVDTCFSAAARIRRYRIKCPHADRSTDAGFGPGPVIVPVSRRRTADKRRPDRVAAEG
jgi:hypothetical protein